MKWSQVGSKPWLVRLPKPWRRRFVIFHREAFYGPSLLPALPLHTLNGVPSSEWVTVFVVSEH